MGCSSIEVQKEQENIKIIDSDIESLDEIGNKILGRRKNNKFEYIL